MRINRSLHRTIASLVLVTFAAIIPDRLNARPAAPTSVQIRGNDLGGVVTGTNGPGAGSNCRPMPGNDASGRDGPAMIVVANAGNLANPRSLRLFGEWRDRIAARTQFKG